MTQSPTNLDAKLKGIAEQANKPVEHIREVYETILAEDVFTPNTLLEEIDWFYNKLGLDNYYFQTTPRPMIASHIQSLYAGKILSQNSGGEVGLNLESESPTVGMYVCMEDHGQAIRVERRLEERFPFHRLQSYRTTGTTSKDSDLRLRIYFLSPPNFSNPDAPESETDLQKVASRDFLINTLPQTAERYQALLNKSASNLGPVIDISEKPETKETRIMIAYKRATTHTYFSSISDVLNSHNIHSNRKYIEQFSNGMLVYSIYVDHDFPTGTLENIREDLSLASLLPQTSLLPLFREGHLSMQEMMYAYSAWKFVHQFLTRYSDQYISLANALKDSPENMGILNDIKRRLTKDTFTEGRIYETIYAYPSVVKELYQHFADRHFSKAGRPVKSFDLEPDEGMVDTITRVVSSDLDKKILLAFLQFNQHILKTNFYKDIKTSLAFRMHPAFLPTLDYPETPFAIFYLLGNEFRGFHIRFRDVARGGIRIIRSNNPEAYTHNVESMFDENYRLAHTQQRKNKDIPEGGSKGVILLTRRNQDRPEVAFKKYIDGLLDVLLPNEEIVDHYGKEEILFLGPDEGTAFLVDWASQHARERGYPFWRAFTTGKSLEYGGIPHDAYGMTTRGVHQYVLEILNKYGFNESTITKAQTGGPDGDLGSNEILISKDKTLSIVDGSGVLYDPEGINRVELERLAKARHMVREFKTDLLSSRGFLVTIEDRDVQLPDGTQIPSGLTFRNQFHLTKYSSADLFVPCGGRPSSVHINNVNKLFDDKGKPRFKYIVEGANLFLTQEARLALEKAGVVVYKDASANKGGVTSSSLEVLASLSFNEEEFQEHFAVHDGKIPEFYTTYVGEVHKRIEENASLEFETIWKENQRSKTPRSVVSDEVSNKINLLNDSIQNSMLWDNPALRRAVLQEYVPIPLQELVGLDNLLKRIPENYLRAIFGAHIASRFVYKTGMQSNEVGFFEFVNKLSS